MRVCHYLPGDMGGGGYPETVTNGDMGGGEGSLFVSIKILNIC